MLEEIGLVSSVYHKPAETFITPKVGPKPIDETGEEENMDLEGEEYSEETGDDEDIFNEVQEDTQDANFVF